ncbi:MAG: GDSL-type esterase/lipase family protein [Anaerolineae bacterium]
MTADDKSGERTSETYPLRDAVECTPRRGLANFLSKLQAGDDVRIAYLGGSITAQEGWRVKTLAWFQNAYPGARISEINAAISGTGSGLGAFRLKQDVLRYGPDLLFIEFAVNDSGYQPASVVRSMEGIVRKAWRALPDLDICFVYTLAFETMLKQLQQNKYPPTASAMEAVADHYGIPSIHLGLEIARLEQAGRLVFQGKVPVSAEEKAALGGKLLFSEDAVHPLVETGHVVYAQVVARSMEQFARISAAEPGRHALGQPLASNNWEFARMLPLSSAALSVGWSRMTPSAANLAGRFGHFMPELWQAEPGESLAFSFHGTTAWIYDLMGPDCGAVRVKVDDQPERECLRIDAWGEDHRICWLEAATALPEGEHTITITVSGEMPDKEHILFERSRPDFAAHPEKYAGTTWYASALLLIGEVI